MKKIIRGLILAACVFASSSAALFAEEWKICLGSFNVREYADERVQILKARNRISFRLQ